MKELAFVLWNCLWPFVFTLDLYFSAKTRMITKQKEPSTIERGLAALIHVIIWIVVAKSI